MNKTKIEWCTHTWNPVTGCLYDCLYCYAKKQTKRFGGHLEITSEDKINIICEVNDKELHDLHKPKITINQNLKFGNAPYPFGFAPTFHRYRLNEPQTLKKPTNIFVCSMADLFGDWVPDEWIQEVFKACEAAPQHRYLFLTKNPHAYCDYEIQPNDNYWYGQSQDGKCMLTDYREDGINTFLSLEPLCTNPSNVSFDWFKWVIIGAETGNRKGKVIPKREWVENIVVECRSSGVPVFMKNSLAGIWGEPLIQEFPWE